MPFRTDDPHAFVTHTFSECVENHAGMQKIGTKRKRGFEQTHLEYLDTLVPIPRETLERDSQESLEDIEMEDTG